MILSICIPIYNQSVEQLVTQLQKQILELDSEIELKLIDDASSPEIEANNSFFLTGLANTFYKKNETNIGRSAIRNQLAAWATGEFILFLDCDVLVPEGFLKKYFSEVIPTERKLSCGGIKYPRDLADKTGHELKLLYGRQVEEVRLKDGVIESPFLGANLLVAKEVFTQIQFEESITQYGFEDELFRQDFEYQFKEDANLVNNPVIINQIDTNAEFLLKTKVAMETLADLVATGRIIAQDNLRILVAYQQLKSKGLVQSFLVMMSTLEPTILYFLDSSSPNLKVFQLYKLFLFGKALADKTN